MNSFDLSLAIPNRASGEVMASPKYDTKVNPKTEERVKQTVTEGGVTIDKSAAPKLMLDGPLGYKYTQLLDTELSVESMAAVVAAAGQASDGTDVDLAPSGVPGFVSMGSTGPVVEDDTDAGYIFIVAADSLESKDLGEISQNFIDKRLANPQRPLGLAMITDGKPTGTLESLYRVLTPMNVAITTMESGLYSMIAAMKGA